MHIKFAVVYVLFIQKAKFTEVNIFEYNEKVHYLITTKNKWPQILKHRGKQKNIGVYFGPYPTAGIVDKTINSLQKAFFGFVIMNYDITSFLSNTLRNNRAYSSRSTCN